MIEKFLKYLGTLLSFFEKIHSGKIQNSIYISLKVSTLLSIESPHSQEKGAGISNKN